MAQRLKGYRHNNMHNQRTIAERRAKDRMFLLSLNLRNVNINMLSDDELKFLARHEAHHLQIFGYPSGGNNSIRPYHDLPYYVYTESESYPDGHSYRTVNGDAGWGGLPDVPAVDDERYPVNINPDVNRALYSADNEYLSTLEYNEANMVPGTTGHKDDMVPYADSTSSSTRSDRLDWSVPGANWDSEDTLRDILSDDTSHVTHKILADRETKNKVLKLDSNKTHCVDDGYGFDNIGDTEEGC